MGRESRSCQRKESGAKDHFFGVVVFVWSRKKPAVFDVVFFEKHVYTLEN